MPSLENIERFKSKVQSLAKEPEVRAAAGLPLDEILPPESGLSDDLAALLGAGPESRPTTLPPLDDESSLGDLLEQDFSNDEGEVPLELPSDQENLDLFSPLPENTEIDNLDFDQTPLDSNDYNPETLEPGADFDPFSSDLTDDFSNSEIDVPTLDTDFPSLEATDDMGFDGDLPSLEPEEIQEAMDFESSPSGFPLPEGDKPEEEEEFSFNDPSLDTDFPDLAGFATRAEEVASFDANQEAEQFDLGDFSSQFGIGDEDHSDDELNPAQLAEIQTVASRQTLTLSDEDFITVQKNLGKLPLNLKLAIEETIGEKDLVFEDLNRLVQLLLGGGNHKALAVAIGKITGKSIKIPVEKSYGEDVEKEKSSLLYNLRVVMLPILRVSLLISVLAGILVYLGLQFVAKPLWADEHYKLGYDKIKQGLFNEADREFEAAQRLWDWEEWYFKYADAFQDQGDLDRARKLYKQLLGLPNNFNLEAFIKPEGLNHLPKFNKRAILDWAHLESTGGYDGVNPDAAYRRSVVLFNYILEKDPKDKAGLLSMGDTYLKWAEETGLVEVPMNPENTFPIENLLEGHEQTTGLMETPMDWKLLESPNSKIAAKELVSQAKEDYNRSVEANHPYNHYQGTPEWRTRFLKPTKGNINLYTEANRYYTAYRLAYGLDGPVTSRFLDLFIVQDSFNQTQHPEEEFTYTSGSEREVLNLAELIKKNYEIQPEPLTLARVAGYLLDKQLHREKFQKKMKGSADTEDFDDKKRDSFLLEAFPHNQNLLAVPYDYTIGIKDYLYKALQGSGKDIPDLHYQFARYMGFLHNKVEQQKALGAAEIFYQRTNLRFLRGKGRALGWVNTLDAMGKVFVERNEPLQAEQYFLSGIKLYEDLLKQGILRPQDAIAGHVYENLGDLYYRQAANWDQSQKLYEKAFKNYKVAPEGLLYKQAVIHYQKGSFPQALSLLYDLEKENLKQTTLLYSLGNTLFRSGNFFAAEAVYSELDDILSTKIKNTEKLNLEKNIDHREMFEKLQKVKNNRAAALFHGQAAGKTDGQAWTEVMGLLATSQTMELSLRRLESDKTTEEGASQVRVNLQIMNNSRGIPKSEKGKSVQDIEIYSQLPFEYTEDD